jgi:hypothetical protein
MGCMSYERPGPMPPGQPSAFGLNQIGRADEVRTPRPDEALSAITCRDERRISVEFLTLAVRAGLTLAWVGGTPYGQKIETAQRRQRSNVCWSWAGVAQQACRGRLSRDAGVASNSGYAGQRNNFSAPWQCLNFLSEPQRHGSLRPGTSTL